MSPIPLPIRLAVPNQEGTEATATPETPSPAFGIDIGNFNGDGDGAIDGFYVAQGALAASPNLTVNLAAGSSSNHQFWLKDAKIAEDLFTIHRSAKHLVEFTSSMIGSHDKALTHHPIPVMSDGDVLFMTQLSNDIARSVGGISAVRHHGLRTKKRRSRAPAPEQAPSGQEYRRSRESGTFGSSSKRLQASKDKDELACHKCGRKETPEWRKGPEGLLCNVCGLIYAKQRKKLKGREGRDGG